MKHLSDVIKTMLDNLSEYHVIVIECMKSIQDRGIPIDPTVDCTKYAVSIAKVMLTENSTTDIDVAMNHIPNRNELVYEQLNTLLECSFDV